MPQVKKSRKTRKPGRGSTQEFKVLAMCGEELDAAVLRELLRIPGCTVQVCHNLIELLLYLEHETFQLVMIFEGENPSPDCQAAAKQLADAYQETAVVVVKQPAIDEYLSENLERPN